MKIKNNFKLLVAISFFLFSNNSFSQMCDVLPDRLFGTFDAVPVEVETELPINGWRGSITDHILYSLPDHPFPLISSIPYPNFIEPNNAFVACLTNDNNPNNGNCGQAFNNLEYIEVTPGQIYNLGFNFCSLSPKRGMWNILVVNDQGTAISTMSTTVVYNDNSWNHFQASFNVGSTTRLKIQFQACNYPGSHDDGTLMGIDDITLTTACDQGVNEDEVTTVEPECIDCASFNLIKEKKYQISGWVKLMKIDGDNYVPLSHFNYPNTYIAVSCLDSNGSLIGGSEINFYPSGEIIDGWQRIIGDIVIPSNILDFKIGLVNDNEESQYYAFFDDIRINPYDGNLKSFVYDQATQKLMAELDENNYATFYEYDNEGGLVRVKKETEKGVFTIQESRSSTVKKEN